VPAEEPPKPRWKVRILVLTLFALVITACTLWSTVFPPSLERRMTAMMNERGADRAMVASAFANILPTRCTDTFSVRVSPWHAYETTALNAAVITQDLELIKAGLAWGCDVNAVDQHGVTPLMVGCGSVFNLAKDNDYRYIRAPKVETIELLIARGAKLNVRDPGNHGVLSSVIEGDHADVLQCLLAHGANPDEIVGKGETLRSRAYPGTKCWDVLGQHPPKP